MRRSHLHRVSCGPALRRHASAGSRPFCLSYATGVLRAHRLARVLNSLVRVSRRVGRSARNHTTRTLRASWHRVARQTARATSNCEQFVAGVRKPTASSHSPPKRGECTAGAPRPPGQPTPRRPVTQRANASPPCRRASDDPTGGRRAPSPPSAPVAANGSRLNDNDELAQFRPFASERFHVLLNSLFKVLCNFPSRYLFAIGLALGI